MLLVIGDTIIETPNVIRGRSLETGSYRRLLMEYYDSGARWFSAPKPLLEDRLFEFDPAAPTRRTSNPLLTRQHPAFWTRLALSGQRHWQ